jgi:hypothetical protein
MKDSRSDGQPVPTVIAPISTSATTAAANTLHCSIKTSMIVMLPRFRGASLSWKLPHKAKVPKSNFDHFRHGASFFLCGRQTKGRDNGKHKHRPKLARQSSTLLFQIHCDCLPSRASGQK